LLLAPPPLGNASEKQLAPARVFLDVGGQFAGWVHQFSGGQTKAESSNTQVLGPVMSTIPVTSPEVEDLTVTFGVDMAPIWWKWVSESLGGNPGRTHDMAIVHSDNQGRLMGRRVLRQARIKEVTFPIVDATMKDPAYFEVKITAGSSQYEKLGGQAGPPLSKARVLSGSNFQFELGHLPTDYVFKVALPVVSIKFTEVRVGTSRTSTSTIPTVSVGNMMVSLPVTDAGKYFDWADDVIKAGVPQETKLQSSLSLLAPDLKGTLMTIHFDQVGLVKINVAKPETNAAKISTAQVELHVERVRVEMGK